MMRRHFGWFALLAVITISSRAPAQQTGGAGFQRSATRTLVSGADSSAPKNLVSINPLGIVFGYFSAEIEHSFAPSGSIGLAGSYDGTNDFGYSSLDGILRFYPAAERIRGFAIGATIGYTHVNSDYVVYPACVDCYGAGSSYSIGNGASNAFTLGVQGDYSWWIGKEQRFGIEAGLGAKRLFYHGGGRRGSEALPTGRLSIGWGF
ncbi:MAG: hypothetical protein M3Z17_02190 [Gemmatimonadota bacterium]|nr:hypothetical protein [Gemmatimonadota bacterium]